MPSSNLYSAMPLPADRLVLGFSRAILADRILCPAYITIQGDFIVSASDVPPKNTDIMFHEGSTVFPAFTNAHCHLELTGIGPLSEHSFVPWIKELLRSKTGQSESNLQKSISKGVSQLMQSGVGTIIDHVSLETHLSFYKSLPAHLVVIGEVLGIARDRAQASLDYHRKRMHDLPFSYHPSPHAVHTLHREVLSELLQDKTRPLSMHLAESEAETNYLAHQDGEFADFFASIPGYESFLSGNEPVLKRLQECGWDHQPTLVVHGNELDDSDFLFLAARPNTCLVHCPGSWHFFNHRRSPMTQARKHGVRTAIGTDSITSNTSLNYLAEIRLFLASQEYDDIHELLPLLTTNALEIMGIHDRGRIHPGYKADLCYFADSIKLDPLALLKSRSQVDGLIIDGKVL